MSEQAPTQPIFRNSDLRCELYAKFLQSVFFAFSMHDLDSGRTPMWSFGHTTLRDRWIPVGSLRQHKGGKRHSHNPNADNGVLAALRQPSQGRWCGLGGSRLTDRTSRKAASVIMYAGCARVAAGSRQRG